MRRDESTLASSTRGRLPGAKTRLAAVACLPRVLPGQALGASPYLLKLCLRLTTAPGSTPLDGAAATVVMDEEVAAAQGLRPRGRILGYATGGLAPEWVMMAPEVAIGKLCAKLSCQVGDFDLVEINEAFAVQLVALIGVLGLDPEKLNVNGGAVALGHPIGCSGARVLTTLLHALEQKDLSRGLAALCLGGGNAVAMAVERVG